MDLDDQVSSMMTELEKIQDTLAKLVALYPESRPMNLSALHESRQQSRA